MKYYFAPLEGITGYLYRQAHYAFYPGLDRYYTPFLVPKEKKHLSTKERNDVMAEHNQGITVIPQIMSNQPDEFVRIAKVLHEEYGYQEINLNLGCPSKTVVSKKRGSGFLTVPEQLERFLATVCNAMERDGMKLSVKTRLGKDKPEEFQRLLNIFAACPLSELIVHPRVQKDFYNNLPDLNAFSQAASIYEHMETELCYNGDIFQASDAQSLMARFPNLSAIMIGRGLLVNPRLVQEIKVRENGGSEERGEKTAVYQRFLNAEIEKEERKRRYALHRRLMDDYTLVLSGEKNVLFKMKELWLYMSQDFVQPQRYWKKIKKAQKLSELDHEVYALCTEQKLRDAIGRSELF